MERDLEEFREWDDYVLHDVFTDASNGLQGWLIAEERDARAAGDAERADAWRAEWFALGDERSAIGTSDREAQVAAIIRWRARTRAIDAGEGPRVVAE